MWFLKGVLSLLLATSAAQASTLRGLEEETTFDDQESNVIWRRPGHPQISICRCEAAWEHYYIKEHQGSNNTSANSTDNGRRGLLQVGIDNDGFYIIDRVRVVPCDKYGHPIENMHSLVAAQENQVTEEPGDQRHRRNVENVYGKGGGSSKSGGSSGNDKKTLVSSCSC